MKAVLGVAATIWLVVVVGLLMLIIGWGFVLTDMTGEPAPPSPPPSSVFTPLAPVTP